MLPVTGQQGVTYTMEHEVHTLCAGYQMDSSLHSDPNDDPVEHFALAEKQQHLH